MKTFINILLFLSTMIVPLTAQVPDREVSRPHLKPTVQKQVYIEIITGLRFDCEQHDNYRSTGITADDFATIILSEPASMVISNTGVVCTVTRASDNFYFLTLDNVTYTFNYSVAHHTIVKLLRCTNEMPNHDNN